MTARKLSDDLEASPAFMNAIASLQTAFDAYHLLLDELHHVDGTRHLGSQRWTAEMIAVLRDQGETYLDFYMPGYHGEGDALEKAGHSDADLISILNELGWNFVNGDSGMGRARYTAS